MNLNQRMFENQRMASILADTDRGERDEDRGSKTLWKSTMPAISAYNCVHTQKQKHAKRQIGKEMRQRGKEKNGWIMWRKKPNSMRITVEGIFCHKSPGDVMM